MDLKAQGKQWLTFLWEVRMHLLHLFGKGGVGGADQSMLRRNWHAGLSLSTCFFVFSMIIVNKSRGLLKPKVSIRVPKLNQFLCSIRGYVEGKSTSREFPTLPFFSPSSAFSLSFFPSFLLSFLSSLPPFPLSSIYSTHILVCE